MSMSAKHYLSLPLAEVSVGEGKYKVSAIGIPTEDGITVLMFGGSKPHIGAVAIAIPRLSLKNAKKTSSASSVFTLTGHKDDKVARPAAERLARGLKEVVVVAGIHVENATKAEIEVLMKNSKRTIGELKRKLDKLIKRN